MPPVTEAAGMAALLPAWAQPAAYVVLFALSVSGVFVTYLVSHRSEKAKAEAVEAFDPEDLLKSSPFLRLLTAIETIAANALIQSEALKTMAAAGTAYAKLVEDDFDELRVFKAVHEALDRERAKQHGAPPPPGGWGR